jgi:hypothetical protein
VSAPKLTPWFPGHIKPVRPGVYQVFWATSPIPARFDGACWYAGSDNLLTASKSPKPASCDPRKWRGLAEEPK